MYKHSPSRNQRSKGFRLKHVLQICVLVAVCFWLIYQVKHSHDKRKQFDENNANNSLHMEGNSVGVKFGRKDLIQEKRTNKDTESHDGEVEKDNNEEGNIEQDKREQESREEVKHEEETEEEDTHDEEESEENDKHEEATEREDEREDETGEEDRHEEKTGEEETGEIDKHEEQNRAEDKHEEEDQEEDMKAEEKDDGGDEDNEVNEHEQEKTDTDVDGEEEFLNEEKEKEDPIEKVTDGKYEEETDTQTKNDLLIEDHVHDEGSRNTREAREEQYKGDDASSAVTHDAQSTSTENENGSTGHQLNIVEDENKGNITEDGKNTTVVNLHELETAGNGTSTSDEEKKPEVFDSVSQSKSSLASITGLESNDQQGSLNNTDNNVSSVMNATGINISDPSHAHNATEGDRTTKDGSDVYTISLNQVTNSTVTLQNTQVNLNSSNSNATNTVEGNSEESTDSSMKSEFDITKNVKESNVSVESKDGSDTSVLEETTNELKKENPDNIEETDATYEKSDSSTSDNTEEVQYDSTDTSDQSVPVEDKDNHIDLDTLPEIRIEGSNSEEVA